MGRGGDGVLGTWGAVIGREERDAVVAMAIPGEGVFQVDDRRIDGVVVARTPGRAEGVGLVERENEVESAGGGESFAGFPDGDQLGKDLFRFGRGTARGDGHHDQFVGGVVGFAFKVDGAVVSVELGNLSRRCFVGMAAPSRRPGKG